MNTIRFLHTSDWQLGMPRHFLGVESQAVFDADRIAAVRRIGELAREHAVDFVLVAGDAFDDNAVSRQVVLRTFEALGPVGVPVYVLPGNHDVLNAASVFRSRDFVERKPACVHVLEDSEPVAVAEGVELVGVPVRSKHADPLEVSTVLAGLEKGPRRIVVAHGTLDTYMGDTPSVDLEHAVQRGVADYIALGDRHSVTSVGSTGRVWYSGSPEVTEFDDTEEDSGWALLVELGESCEVTPLPVGRWRFLALRRELDTAADLEALSAELDEVEDKSRTVVKLGLTGTVSVALKAQLDEALERWGEVFAAVYFHDRYTDLVVQPDDTDFAGLVSGYGAEAVADLEAMVHAGGQRADDAAGALSLLFRLAGGGRP